MAKKNKKKKTQLQKNLAIIAHNEKHGPSKEELFEVRAWGKATSWVNKRKEDSLWQEQAKSRSPHGEEPSLGQANWGYNKEEWIKKKRREEELEKRNPWRHGRVKPDSGEIK